MFAFCYVPLDPGHDRVMIPTSLVYMFSGWGSYQLHQLTNTYKDRRVISYYDCDILWQTNFWWLLCGYATALVSRLTHPALPNSNPWRDGAHGGVARPRRPALCLYIGNVAKYVEWPELKDYMRRPKRPLDLGEVRQVHQRRLRFNRGDVADPTISRSKFHPFGGVR